MWILILLICSIPVSGALWAEKDVTGILGRAITISCHYEAWWYQSYVKYWCHGWTRQCKVIATTNWRNGRISITDNKTQGIFLVTLKNLQWRDAGRYSCGIEISGIELDLMFNVNLHISEETVSVPGLQFLSQPKISWFGVSVTVSCESARGSLPIHYTWSEKMPSQDSMISDTNKLDLHCQSFTQQHHQYYCTASNTQGTKPSEIVHVSVNNVREKNCSYRIQINSIVSDVLMAAKHVTGILGRAITISCYYENWWYQSNMKYWCHGRNRSCNIIAKTDWPNGRISITDNKTQGIFLVAMKNLQWEDAGWYSCGIQIPGIYSDLMFNVNLHISEEAVSVPGLRFLSQPKTSWSGFSVTCESARGSLPIHYTWSEKMPSQDSMISDTNKLDLHCQSFTQQHHQYYCTASNTQGTKPSEIVHVSVNNVREKNCSYRVQINSIVSDVLMAAKHVTGILGRAITISCYYENWWYQSNMKYWCHGRNRSCNIIAKTDWPNGRISITDNKTQGIFLVAMKNLQWEDAGWYSCGIQIPGIYSDLMFNVNLHISEEAVSVPGLRFLSQPKTSWSGFSVTCESARGSLPIHYTWSEKMPSQDSMISDTNKLDLHCQSFTQQHHQYYCTASNTQGTKPSEIVHVSVNNVREKNCSYRIQINSIVSDVLMAAKHVTGILGRAITISCYYENWWYQSNMKYWCHGRNRSCNIIAKTDWPNGRISITENKTQGIFLVTMKNLQWEDAGWYSCGIQIPGIYSDLMFNVNLHISEEAVSVPGLRFLSQPNVSCSGGSVTVSSESAQGSLPIHYTWSEKMPSQDSMIADTNKLDLHCQSFTQKHHQYYCTASNIQGTKPSEIVHVSVNNVREKNCSYRIQINSIGEQYTCAVSSTTSPGTTHSPDTSGGFSTSQNQSPGKNSHENLVYILVGVLGAILVVFALLLYLRQINKGTSCIMCHQRTKSLNDEQEMVSVEENLVYANINHIQRNTAERQRERRSNLKNDEITYAVLAFQKKSSSLSGGLAMHTGDNSDSVTYSELNFPNQPPKGNKKAPKRNTPQESGRDVYTEHCDGPLHIDPSPPWMKPSFSSRSKDPSAPVPSFTLIFSRLQSRPVTQAALQGEQHFDDVTHGGVRAHSGQHKPNFKIVPKLDQGVTGAVWAEKGVTGILGRAITISCQYEARRYQSHKKYWCLGWTRQCNVIATTNWPNGRISITDNKTQGIFLVTMKNLQWRDAGWYSCGIEMSGYDPMFNVKLHISDEAISVPGLRFLSQPNVSCSGGSVTVSCESARGSLPIHYTWSEKMPSQDSKISDTNKLDLHCQSFTQQQHQYYCSASNTQGTKSSEIVHVSVNNVREKNCNYRIQINSIGGRYNCTVSSTTSPGTTHSPNTSGGSSASLTQLSGNNSHETLVYIVVGVLGAILVVFAVALLLYLRQINKGTLCIMCQQSDKSLNNGQELVPVEENLVYANINHTQRNTAERQSKRRSNLKNDEITYAALEFQKKSLSLRGGLAMHTGDNSDSVTYSELNFPTQPPKGNKNAPKRNTPQESGREVYADITF
ncbi:uncharacterized protein LOC132828092 [Hemiscyllium ocellatum]|uniref:uncharacterized protein LOC132828092 n=1 Tax=Hemiscyllium ocellatum TaxID=170820 RepID=UPI0029677595|nr:uncharacterized protein LOC132828092 [Hemiscyllium ocellatum]